MTPSRDDVIGAGSLGLALALAIVSGKAAGADLGTMPDWIGAIGTAGALLIGFAALRTAVEDSHDATERARFAAARKLKLEVTYGSGSLNKVREIALHYRNASDEIPFVNIAVVVHRLDQQTTIISDDIAVLPPEQDFHRSVTIPWSDAPFGWWCLYDDEVGVRWRRDHNGIVTRAAA